MYATSVLNSFEIVESVPNEDSLTEASLKQYQSPSRDPSSISRRQAISNSALREVTCSDMSSESGTLNTDEVSVLSMAAELEGPSATGFKSQPLAVRFP